MDSPLSTRSALLQALRHRGGYGLELIRRLEGVGVSVAEATVYPTLKELEGEGLIRSVRLVPKGRRGGRARIYYHLTAAGSSASEADRKVLGALLALSSADQPTDRDRELMAMRLIEADELGQSGEDFRLTIER